MSSVDVERQLAEYFGWLDDQMGAVSCPAGLDPAVVAPRIDGDRRGRRGWWSVAAVAMVFALVAGLVLIAGRDADDAVSTELPTPAGGLLGEVDDVRDGEWVYPSVVPDGVEYAYPTLMATPHPVRSILFASEGGGFGYVVEVVPAESDRTVGEPSSELVDVGGRADEQLGGRVWEVVSTDDTWFATSHLVSTTVRVSGPVAFDDSARAFIEGLVVIDEADLPSPPLDFDGGDFVEVARYDSDDGLAAAIRVTESNSFFCIKIYDGIGGGGGGGCGVGLSADDVLSGVNVATGQASDGEGVRFDVAGIARSDVARVEIEFVDGSVLRTTPTDLSGQHDVLFWVAATNMDGVDRGSDSPSDGLDPVLTEIRAYDATGALLATQSPAGGLSE